MAASRRGAPCACVRVTSLCGPWVVGIGLLLSITGCWTPRAEKATGPIAGAIEASLAGGKERFENTEWHQVLAAAVDREGLVDYRAVQARRALLDAYLDRVARVPLDRLAPGHLEALLINAYNALTVRSILAHPSVTSIKDISGVWTKVTHTVGGHALTLDTIEHKLLRPFFKDPRLHFALNCASWSCAPLPAWAYEGDRIDEQLEGRARLFFRSPRNLEVVGDVLKVSMYFKWFGADFTAVGARGRADSIAAYVRRYAPPEAAALIDRAGGKPSIGYVDYDWRLNATVAPDPTVRASPGSGVAP